MKVSKEYGNRLAMLQAPTVRAGGAHAVWLALTLSALLALVGCEVHSDPAPSAPTTVAPTDSDGSVTSQPGRSDEPPSEPSTAHALPCPSEVQVEVPDVVDENLADARRALRSIALSEINPYDAERGRWVIVERHWRVVAQEPEAGVLACPLTTMNLGVRKYTDR